MFSLKLKQGFLENVDRLHGLDVWSSSTVSDESHLPEMIIISYYRTRNRGDNTFGRLFLRANWEHVYHYHLIIYVNKTMCMFVCVFVSSQGAFKMVVYVICCCFYIRQVGRLRSITFLIPGYNIMWCETYFPYLTQSVIETNCLAKGHTFMSSLCLAVG